MDSEQIKSNIQQTIENDNKIRYLLSQPEKFDIEIKEKGYVYCLSHPLYGEVYKIGCTQTTPDEIAKHFSDGSQYIYFKVECSKYVVDYFSMEKTLHNVFAKYRVRDDRDFFKLSLKKIKDMLVILKVMNKPHY